jgi:hypothetical protein
MHASKKVWLGRIQETQTASHTDICTHLDNSSGSDFQMTSNRSDSSSASQKFERIRFLPSLSCKAGYLKKSHDEKQETNF